MNNSDYRNYKRGLEGSDLICRFNRNLF